MSAEAAPSPAPASSSRASGSRRSLAGRLIWLAAGWSLLALAVMGVILTTLFHDAAIERLEEIDKTTIGELEARTEIAKDGALTPPDLADPQTHGIYGGKYWQIAEIGPDGRLSPLARSRSLWESDLNAPPRGAPALKKLDQQVAYDSTDALGHPVRVIAHVATLPNRAAPLIFMAAIDRQHSDRDVAQTTLLTWIALTVMGAGLLFAVVVQVRVGLKPLFQLEQEIADARKGKVQRLSGDYPKEIAPLAEELNALLDHNREVVERQRSHVGNLAHALKTPIAVMLSEAERRATPAGEAACEPLAEVVKRQTEAMRGHVEHHLRRARAAARAQNLGERTPVEPVLDELASLLERVFHDKGVTIDWRAPETLVFRGERQDLQEVAGNILENACIWCRAKVRATAEPMDAAGAFLLVVEDDGPGLPEDRRAEVLKRGARLDESAPGSGLGLSIVDELARAYGGRVELGKAALGGLRVEVRLPAAER